MAKKAKKSLFYKLSLGFALLATLLVPVALSANLISHYGAFQIAAASAAYNSQTMPLLSPAINLDPHPSVGGGDIAVVDGSALLPEQGPSGGAADITDHPSSSQISVYTVRSGDTLSEIAKMFGVSVNTIVWANDIKNGVIHPGDDLVILPITGVRHVVIKGETLATLAKKFKADADEIASYNNLPENADLAVGSIIMIPDGEIIAPPPPPRSSGPTAPIRGAGGPAISGYYIWPVVGGIITQGLHGLNGVDIGAPRGTNILASAEGTVIIARSGGYNGGYGSYVVIQHSNGTQTLYAHASSVLVSVGDQVVAGQTIAKIGSTGKATGPHLHFEVRGAANPFAKLGVGVSGDSD